MLLIGIFKKATKYAEMLNAKEIARRMFVTNSFDGLLTALGIILGSFIAGSRDLNTYFASVGGASLAMGVFSGMLSTYFSERAERLRELHETERVMLRKLSTSIYAEAAKLVPLYVALWSGIGATLLPLVGASPFLFCQYLFGTCDLAATVYTSVAIIISEMFALGYYLGLIGGEKPLLSGLRLAGIGVAAALVLTAIKVIVG